MNKFDCVGYLSSHEIDFKPVKGYSVVALWKDKFE